MVGPHISSAHFPAMEEKKRKERFSYQFLNLNLDQTNPMSGNDPWGRHLPVLQLLMDSAGITQCPPAKAGILLKSKCRQSGNSLENGNPPGSGRGNSMSCVLVVGWVMEHLQICNLSGFSSSLRMTPAHPGHPSGREQILAPNNIQRCEGQSVFPFWSLFAR